MSVFLVWLFKALFFIIHLLPTPVKMLMGDFLGWLWFDLLKIRRDIVLDNISKAYPDWDEEQKKKVGRLSCNNLGRSFIEFASILCLKQNQKSLNQFELKDLHYLSQAQQKNKGVCVLTLHLGNPDLGIAGLALHGVPLVVISKLFKIKWLNKLWFGVRKKMGTEFIAPRNSSYAILKALKKNKTVVFVQDQFMGPPIGGKTTFFGHETGTALGLSVMVSRSKAPIVPVYTYRDKNNKHVIQFLPEVEYDFSLDSQENLLKLTQKCNHITEEIIKKHPEQWMWVHRRWKRFGH